MKNGWTERIKELEAENKRLAALNDMFPQEIARLEDRVSAEYEAERADDRARIQELEAEVGRLMLMNPCNHTGFESAPCDVCGYPDPRKLIATVTQSRDDWKREWRLLNAGLNMAEDKIKELEAERADRIVELEALLTKKDNVPDFARGFNAGRSSVLRHNESGCCCLFDEEDNIVSLCEAHKEYIDNKLEELRAENKRLRELVDGARVIVEVFQWSTPAQERWREEWLKKAAKALKEASDESK